MSSQIYIGLLSGTSMNSIDAGAVSFTDNTFKLLGTFTSAFPVDLQKELRNLCKPGVDEVNLLGKLDRNLGILFANVCNDLLKKLNISSAEVAAIGSHGQTIRHQPCPPDSFTLQIGDPNIIAEMTGITTVADFRRRDMACGGQGAPLTPAFHRFAFQSSKKNRVIVNIGGIANLSFLPADETKTVEGFDSGPGNTLLDRWINKHLTKPHDEGGEWAKQGTVSEELLHRLLEDPYFKLSPPKSTGPEYFHLEWLAEKAYGLTLSPKDVQATLAELTAISILRAVSCCTAKPCEIFVCGGGAHNKDLMTRLERKKGGHELFTTDKLGVDPDWVEAIAFAWMAKQTLNRLPSNIPQVTGASRETVLGGIYLAN